MESEDMAEEEREYRPEAPPIDFSSDDDSDTDYDDDAVKIPCFRAILSRKATSMIDSEPEDTTDSEIESQ